MLADRVTGYEVKVLEVIRGRKPKVVVRKEFHDYDKAMAFLDQAEIEYARTHTVEFNTKWR
jgi:hypothetical protein